MKFLRHLLKVGKKIATINWGHSHPKDDMIRKAIVDIENETQDEPMKSVRSHLVVCKSCAEVGCGLLNQARSSKRFAT